MRVLTLSGSSLGRENGSRGPSYITATPELDGTTRGWLALFERYEFTEDLFPPNALDEHVEIGRFYFDVLDTEYVIEPLGANRSELIVRMRFRVSTHFNGYARSVASLLVSNFEETILELVAKGPTLQPVRG